MTLAGIILFFPLFGKKEDYSCQEHQHIFVNGVQVPKALAPLNSMRCLFVVRWEIWRAVLKVAQNTQVSTACRPPGSEIAGMQALGIVTRRADTRRGSGP